MKGLSTSRLQAAIYQYNSEISYNKGRLKTLSIGFQTTFFSHQHKPDTLELAMGIRQIGQPIRASEFHTFMQGYDACAHIMVINAVETGIQHHLFQCFLVGGAYGWILPDIDSCLRLWQ